MVDIINNMKYDFDPSLKSIYTKFVPPFNEAVFFFSRLVVHLSPYPRKLKKVVDVKIIKSQNKADNFKIYTISKKGSNIDSLTPVFYLHGGAFAFNASSNHYKIAANYVLQNDIVLYFLDYDTKLVHPDLEKQVEKAFKLLKLNGEETILMGDSAGGYLCLDLYAKLRKAKALMLFYPVVTTKNFESKEIFKDTPIWNSQLNKKMWKRFLNNQEVDDILDLDFSNIPKTYIETCEYDCLKDEGLALADKFKAEHHIIKKAMHGFDIVKSSYLTTEAFNKRNAFIHKVISEN